jgi:NAD(P)-dependent dehydrogenase (short-subunit alcohol dehydrogenase family)
MMRYDGKIVVVTVASSAIDRAIVRAFADDGTDGGAGVDGAHETACGCNGRHGCRRCRSGRTDLDLRATPLNALA